MGDDSIVSSMGGSRYLFMKRYVRLVGIFALEMSNIAVV